ncbi:MAG: hypothetical protein Q7S76_03410 [bacterium]|nr:hypothetical protein [bacterium]
MDSSNEHIESLSRNVEEYEKNARRRAWLSSIIPLLIGAVVLGYTVWQIQNYSQKLELVQVQLDQTTEDLGTAIITLDDTKEKLDQADTDLVAVKDQLTTTTAELESTQKELEGLRDQLEQTTRDLQNANVFIANNVAVDFFSVKGGSLDAYPSQEELLLYILQLQESGIGWNRDGFSEEEGFNSPSFAIYVLKQCGLVSGDTRAESKPWESSELDETIRRLSIGDLVYYKDSGFSMFYFELDGESFVIGMTPLGILAQKIEFAPNPVYLGVPYENYESCFD